MADRPQNARDWLDLVLGPGSSLLFEDVVAADPLSFPGYAEQVADARARTGCSAGVLVAEGSIGERAVVAISFEFGFIGGSMGVAEGERICRAFELAADRKVPVVALTASGGARMQEGMLALGQMPATIAARARLAAAHQPFIAYLRNPTTGGVYASFASSADVILAEPGATIGFAGPRVAEAFTGQSLPAGSHTAEWATKQGLVSWVVEPFKLRSTISAILDLFGGSPQPAGAPPEPEPRALDGWTAVQRARDPDRPAPDTYVGGTRLMRIVGGGALDVAGTTFGGNAVVAIATAKARRLTALDYRNARRGISTAVRLGLPLVTLVDTPGADPSSPAEASGVARQIAATFSDLIAARVPTVAVVTGEGGSGGALALAACDRLLIQDGAYFSVIAPEGAAAILRRDDVEQVARDLRPTAHDLRALGIADRVLSDDPSDVPRAVAWALADIAREGAPTSRRTARWRP